MKVITPLEETLSLWIFTGASLHSLIIEEFSSEKETRVEDCGVDHPDT
jgi:hypothetical protein